jgi:type IV secretory pathway TrbD component
MSEPRALESDAPPAGEEIHLPGPSLVPVLNAFGVALALVGLTTTWIVSVVGLVLFLVTLVRWVRHTRRDIDQLPLDHSTGH